MIFDGPSASSVPSSASSFAHRGSRTSFADEERTGVRFFAEEFDEDAEDVLTELDPEEEDRHSMSSSRVSEASSVAVMSTPEMERRPEFPLIARRKSGDQRSDTSASGRGRVTQRIYLADEDMVVVMSGFKTRIARLWLYRVLSLVTCGLFYLLMRWLPRWRLRFIAEPLPLSEANWVVVEVTSLFCLSSDAVESVLRFVDPSNPVYSVRSSLIELFRSINCRRSGRRSRPRENTLFGLQVHPFRLSSSAREIRTHVQLA